MTMVHLLGNDFTFYVHLLLLLLTLGSYFSHS